TFRSRRSLPVTRSTVCSNTVGLRHMTAIICSFLVASSSSRRPILTLSLSVFFLATPVLPATTGRLRVQPRRLRGKVLRQELAPDVLVLGTVAIELCGGRNLVQGRRLLEQNTRGRLFAIAPDQLQGQTVAEQCRQLQRSIQQ